MAEVHHGPPNDMAPMRAALAQMLMRNEWRLIELDELAERVQASVASAPPPDVPAAGAGRAEEALAGAALRIYAEELCRAYFDGADDARQRRAYDELLHYAFRAIYRFGPELSRDDRAELAHQVVAELYSRYAPAGGEPQVRTPGAFLAMALQQSRNAVRRWRATTRPWISLTADDDGPVELAELADMSDARDPVARFERRERRSLMIRTFARAIRQHPRAKTQLHVVWLHVVEELEYTTIADRLQMTVANVRVLCSRGLKHLRSDPGFDDLAADFCPPGTRLRPPTSQGGDSQLEHMP